MLAALFLLSVGSDSVSRQSCRSAGDLPALRSLLSLPFSTSGLHTHAQAHRTHKTHWLPPEALESHAHSSLDASKARELDAHTHGVITSYARHIKSSPAAHHSLVKLKVSHPKLAICCRPAPRMRQMANRESQLRALIQGENRTWRQK